MFAALESYDFFWIVVFVGSATVLIVGLAVGRMRVQVQTFRKKLPFFEMQLMRLEHKLDLLLKQSQLSEGDQEVLREINRKFA